MIKKILKIKNKTIEIVINQRLIQIVFMLEHTFFLVNYLFLKNELKVFFIIGFKNLL